jgi:hypothetical protein
MTEKVTTELEAVIYEPERLGDTGSEATTR